jgi:hypothetical protein
VANEHGSKAAEFLYRISREESHPGLNPALERGRTRKRIYLELSGNHLRR